MQSIQAFLSRSFSFSLTFRIISFFLELNLILELSNSGLQIMLDNVLSVLFSKYFPNFVFHYKWICKNILIGYMFSSLSQNLDFDSLQLKLKNTEPLSLFFYSLEFTFLSYTIEVYVEFLFLINVNSISIYNFVMLYFTFTTFIYAI